MGKTKTNTTPLSGEGIQIRRSSRLALSKSAITKEHRNGTQRESTASPTSPSSTSSSDTPIKRTNDRKNTATTITAAVASATGTGESSSSTATTTNATNNYVRVTRSTSSESNSNEESPKTTKTQVNGKRRRNSNNTKASSNKKRATPAARTTKASSSSTKKQPRDHECNTTTRLATEVKDTERAAGIKRKLDELDELEKSLQDPSHEVYQKLFAEVEAKRARRMKLAHDKREMKLSNITNEYLAIQKAANDKFNSAKEELRQKMTRDLERKITLIRLEHGINQRNINHTSNYQYSAEWIPPPRPSVINILFYYQNDDEYA